MNDQTLAEAITRHVRESPNQQVVGARLAQLLQKQGYSSLDHGRLIDVIKRTTPMIDRVGKSGMDWLYGFKPAGAAPGGEASPWNQSVWRAFASPSGAYRLFVRVDSGLVYIAGPGQVEPATPWIRIPSVTSDQFLHIAREWLETKRQDESIHRTLEVSMEGGVGPQSSFLKQVQDLGLAQEWERYRKDAVLRLLHAELEKLTLPNPEACVDQVRAAITTIPMHASTPQPRVGGKLSLRQALIETIKTMPESELIRLNMPAGYLYRALRGD